VHANTVGAVCTASQGAADVPQQGAVAVEVANSQLALSGVLYFVKGVGALFDFDPFTIYDYLEQFGLLLFESVLQFVEF
jgi:hypothetical protein